ncbi:MAG: hypothetical protein A2Y23_06250 [Clostridiales bacterium GWB2_37_7]|nr:MAG: hypothetical protein A2Y23_06250 [Clostridiales bacterium GWB2_37_7]
MKVKVLVLVLTFVLLISLLAGCTQPAPAPSPEPTTPPATTPEPTPTTPPETTPDVTTTASIVNDEAAFEKAMSNTGTWIIATLKDLTFTKDLLLDGEFKNGKKDEAGKDIIQRKIALYAQDENRKVTARYTLTAPKLTINSPKARIQSGTFKGDLYVSAKDFELVDATVDGNVYFTTDEAKSTFTMDETSKVTGKQELKKQ